MSKANEVLVKMQQDCQAEPYMVTINHMKARRRTCMRDASVQWLRWLMRLLC
jgi:uncharacterized membrane protein